MDINKEVMDWMGGQSSLSNKEKREIEKEFGNIDNMENDFFANVHFSVPLIVVVFVVVIRFHRSKT